MMSAHLLQAEAIAGEGLWWKRLEQYNGQAEYCMKEQ